VDRAASGAAGRLRPGWILLGCSRFGERVRRARRARTRLAPYGAVHGASRSTSTADLSERTRSARARAGLGSPSTSCARLGRREAEAREDARVEQRERRAQLPRRIVITVVERSRSSLVRAGACSRPTAAA
jgi:hypothetical protein